MVVKRPAVLELYRGGAPLPSGDMDEQILAAAQASRPRRPLRFALPAAAAMAAAMALMIILRWYAPAESGPEYTITNYGMEEGQAQSWLRSFQPSVTATGPASQEGIS